MSTTFISWIWYASYAMLVNGPNLLGTDFSSKLSALLNNFGFPALELDKRLTSYDCQRYNWHTNKN